MPKKPTVQLMREIKVMRARLYQQMRTEGRLDFWESIYRDSPESWWNYMSDSQLNNKVK